MKSTLVRRRERRNMMKKIWDGCIWPSVELYDELEARVFPFWCLV
jgi:hypothetical protein